MAARWASSSQIQCKSRIVLAHRPFDRGQIGGHRGPACRSLGHPGYLDLVVQGRESDCGVDTYGHVRRVHLVGHDGGRDHRYDRLGREIGSPR